MESVLESGNLSGSFVVSISYASTIGSCRKTTVSHERLYFLRHHRKSIPQSMPFIKKKHQYLASHKEPDWKADFVDYISLKTSTPLCHCAYSPYCSLYISQGADQENLLNNQEHLRVKGCNKITREILFCTVHGNLFSLITACVVSYCVHCICT